MAPLLTRKRQLIAALETTPNTTPASFPSAAQADCLVSELTVSPEVETFAEDYVRDSITALKETAGKKVGTTSFKTNLKGTRLGTFAAGGLTCGHFLQACGFTEDAIQSIPIGAITGGPFRKGETVTGGTSSATGIVAVDCHSGAADLFLVKDSISGTFAAEALTGAETGATATSTAGAADEGYAYNLITIPLKEFDLTATWSTAPTAGDVLEGATSGARCIYSQDISTTVIEFRELRGTFADGEVLNNLTSGATSIGTLATPTREEYRFGGPIHQQVQEDGVAVRLGGSRGDLTIEAEVNRPVKLAFTFRGVLVSATDAANLTGIDYDYTTAPLWAGAVSGFADNENSGDVAESAEQDPCMRTLNLALGAQLADRECSGAAGGMHEVFIADRQGTFNMDPEATPEADIGWLTALINKQVQRLRVAVGTADGNRFTIFTPGLQIDAAPSGDRDGLMTRQVSGKMTGGDVNNLNGTPDKVSSIGGDNELTIIYHTS